MATSKELRHGMGAHGGLTHHEHGFGPIEHGVSEKWIKDKVQSHFQKNPYGRTEVATEHAKKAGNLARTTHARTGPGESGFKRDPHQQLMAAKHATVALAAAGSEAHRKELPVRTKEIAQGKGAFHQTSGDSSLGAAKAWATRRAKYGPSGRSGGGKGKK